MRKREAVNDDIGEERERQSGAASAAVAAESPVAGRRNGIPTTILVYLARIPLNRAAAHFSLSRCDGSTPPKLLARVSPSFDIHLLRFTFVLFLSFTSASIFSTWPGI